MNRYRDSCPTRFRGAITYAPPLGCEWEWLTSPNAALTGLAGFAGGHRIASVQTPPPERTRALVEVYHDTAYLVPSA